MSVHPAVAAALLSWASATDNREVTREASIAWAAALDDNVTIDDGKDAITTHRRTSTDWLMPLHVNTEVRRIRKARTEAIGDVTPPPQLADRPAVENSWKREYTRAIGDGEQPEGAMRRACAAVDVPVPAQIEGTHPMPAVGHLARRIPLETT